MLNGPPVSGRPICCATACPVASVAVKVHVAGSEPPSWSVLALFGVPLRIGRSRYTVLTSTSALGMTYEACPLNDVWNGDETLQYGLVANAPFSGTALRMSHQSFSTLPVLVPPEKVTPFTLRTLKVMSTPLKTRRSSPMSLVDLSTRLCTRVNASAVLLYSGPSRWPPPFGRRASVGALT